MEVVIVDYRLFFHLVCEHREMNAVFVLLGAA
jgi:hypothetical protein